MIPLFLNLVSTAADRLLRNWERSLTLTLCLVAILFPFLTAMAVSDGLRFQTRLSLEQGADFTFTGNNYGGPGPVSQTDLTRLQHSLQVDGVRVNGRIIGRTYFVNRLIAVVGLDQPPWELGSLLSAGRIFQREGEVLLGYHLARTFNLQTGVRFSLTANPGKLFTLVGVLPPLGLWDSDLMVLSVRDAQQFFRMGGHFSEIQINTVRDTRPVPGLWEKNAGAYLSGPFTLQRMSRE
jgi:ABC-type lipoprotein release transport system permease subunit